MNLTCCYIAKCNAKRTGCLSESIKVTWYCQVSQDSSQAQYLSKCTCFWPVGERQICFSSFLVKCRWYDNHECVGKDWAESWVVSCFFFFSFSFEKSWEKQTEECITGTVLFFFFFVIYMYEKQQEWMHGKNQAPGPDRPTGTVGGWLVGWSALIWNIKKTNFVLSCVSAALWLAGSLLGVCECVCVYAPGVMNLSHTICLVPSTLFSPVDSALRVAWGLSWQGFVWICENCEPNKWAGCCLRGSAWQSRCSR